MRTKECYVELTPAGGVIRTEYATIELIGQRMIVRRTSSAGFSMARGDGTLYMLDGATADLFALLVRALGGQL